MDLFEIMKANSLPTNTFKDGSSLNVDPSELKSLSVKLNDAIKELIEADKEEKMAWEEAKAALGPKMTMQLKSAFEKTDNEYYNAIFLLNKYADSLARVSNIWENAEDRIMKAISIAESADK